MVFCMVESKIPPIVYVSPSGANFGAKIYNIYELCKFSEVFFIKTSDMVFHDSMPIAAIVSVSCLQSHRGILRQTAVMMRYFQSMTRMCLRWLIA